MKLITNNGIVINDAPVMSEQTRKYLNRFWKFPSKKEVEAEKEKYYSIDYRTERQKKGKYSEHDISNVI